MPKANTAGNIAIPANRAINVSAILIFNEVGPNFPLLGYKSRRLP